MRNNFNRFVASCLAALTIASILPTAALAEDVQKPGTLIEKYINEANGKEIAEAKESKITTEIQAPQTIEGFSYTSFSQLTEHVYAKEDITYIQGYPDKTVSGEGNLTRAEAATIFYRLMDGYYPAPTRQLKSSTFTDVPKDAWYGTELEMLYNAGMIDGYKDNTLRPDAAITRAEFSMMVALFNDLPKSEKAMFSDVTKDHWAYQHINAAANAGWIKGYRDGTFQPEEAISRSETVSLINKMRNRSITTEKLKSLGVKNPYIDLVESYWAYADLLEASIKHSAKDWHKLTYNDGNMNLLVERFVNAEGKEIAKPIITKAKENHDVKEFERHFYLGYITTITYVYENGNAEMTASKAVDKKTAKVGDTLTYTVKVQNAKKATAPLVNLTMEDALSEYLEFVSGSVLVDGKSAVYAYDNQNSKLSVSLGDLSSNQSKTVTFQCKVSATAYGKTIENLAVLNADNHEKVNASCDGTVIAQGKIQPMLEKSADKTEAKVGDTITYTLIAGNGDTATYPWESAVITDQIPADLLFVDGSVYLNGKAADYTFKKGVLQLDLGDIAPSKSHTITFKAVVQDTAYGKTIYNTAVGTGKNTPELEAPDKGVDVEDGKAIMSIEKSSDKPKAKVGDTITYTVIVTNDEKATVDLRNVTIEDTLTEYVDFTNGSLQVDGKTAKYSYDKKTKLLTVELGDIAPSKSVTVTFDVKVNDTAYGKSFKNTAIAKADNEEDKPGTDGGTDIEGGKTYMSISKSVSKSTAKVGDTLTYTIKASNDRDAEDSLKNVVISDTISQYVDFTPGSVQVAGKSASYSYDAATRLLTINLPDIAPDKSITVTFDVKVNDTAYGKSFKNTAILSADGEPDQPGTDGGTDIEGGNAFMEVSKSVSKSTAKVGDMLTYTIKVKNTKAADDALKNVILEDVISSYVNFTPGSVQMDGMAVKHSYDENTRLLKVDLGDIAPNETRTITFTVTVNDTAYGKSFKNTAIAKAENDTDKPGTDGGTDIEDGKAFMSVTKSVDKKVAKVGDTLIYTIKATNSSAAEVNLKNVVMHDTLSEYVTLHHGSVQVDGYAAKNNYDPDTRLLTVDLENIAPNQTKVITFTVVVNSVAYGKAFENTVILKADNDSDKTAKDGGVTIDEGTADGRIASKTVSKPTAKVGDTLTYTIQLSNGATATADWAGMTVTDAIPHGLTFAGNVQKNGTATTEYGYDAGTRTLTLQPAPIQPSEKATFTFNVTVDDGTQGRHIVNTAVLDDNGDKTNIPDTGVTIDSGDTLPSVTKKADVSEAKIGDVFWYTVTVKNGAKATAPWKNIRFTDTLPAEVELVGGVLVDGTTVLHSQSGNVISVPLDDLNAGESYEITFRVQLMQGTAGSKFQNVAVVEGDNGKGTGTDNGVKIPETSETESPNTQGKKVTKDVDKTVVQVGKNSKIEERIATFSIDVVNDSQADWTNVRIEDFINTQKVKLMSDSVIIDGQRISLGQGWNFSDSKFTASLGIIKAGEKKTVQFALEFKSDNEKNSKYINHVTVLSDEQTVTASSPEILITKEYDGETDITDNHYRLIHGSLDWQTGKLNWEPNRNIFLEEMAILAYRLMTNDSKNIVNSTGTTSVPAFVSEQYRAEEAEAIAFFIRNNVLPAGVFNKTTNPVISNPLDNIDHIEGTQNHFTALLTFATGKNLGLSGTSKITRIEAARKVCVLTVRDESPNTGSYVLAQFEDVASTEKTIVEVSNTHDYVIDSYGNEIWVTNSSMKD